jgi:hypothetical protein
VEKLGVRVRSLVGGFSDVSNGLCVALHVGDETFVRRQLTLLPLRNFVIWNP